jgi:branched-chain amino acid transport system permease protein
MRRLVASLALLGLLLAFPLVVRNEYYHHLMILALLWVLVGTAWNLLAGFAGQVSFGHAAFFGVGAYTAGLLDANMIASAWWGLLLGGLAAVVLAFPFGWLTFRLRGAYFALGTLALGEVMRHVATIWEGFTGGMAGILILQTFRSKLPYYYIILGFAVAAVLAAAGIMRTKLGYCFLAVREDQDAAASLGIDTTLYKMIALAVSAFMIGVAGAFYMNYMGFIDPEVVFNLHHISIMAILVVIVGGVGTILGPVAGAFIMTGIEELFRTGGFGLLSGIVQGRAGSPLAAVAGYLMQMHVLVFGLLVILVILYLPNGLVGDWSRIRAAVRRGGRRR